MIARGMVRKMRTQPTSPVTYHLRLGDELLPVNPRIGRGLTLAFDGEIHCVHCGRTVKKTFHQGYCYPCFTTLAETDRCLVRPELCHHHLGTCRDPAWGDEHCMRPHTVYLANSSGLKVGITRGREPAGRWIDQGAAQGLSIRVAETRLESGLVEVALKDHVADKTAWQRILKGAPDPVDLEAERDRILAEHEAEHPGAALAGRHDHEASPVAIEYPVAEYPLKVRSHDLDKEPRLEGTLLGAKGQYLIFDGAVINVRKYQGYVLEASFEE